MNLVNFRFISRTEGFTNANIAAERALALNPRLAEAHVSYAYLLASRREYVRAEAEFRRALDLNPNFALGRHYYSLLLAMLNRTDEALEQNRRARELDPLLMRRRPTTESSCASAASLPLLTAPSPKRSRSNQISCSRFIGSAQCVPPRAPTRMRSILLEQAARASPNFTGVPGALAYVYAHTGRPAAADSIVASLQKRANDNRGRANLAYAHAALGKLDAAFALLRQLDWDVPSVYALQADPLSSTVGPIRATLR